MSANNYILIDRNTFAVTMRDAEAGALLEKIGKGKDIDEAIDIAQNYNGIVEYGISFTDKSKKIATPD